MIPIVATTLCALFVISAAFDFKAAPIGFLAAMLGVLYFG